MPEFDPEWELREEAARSASPTSPLPCGHDESEIRRGNRGMPYCQRCEDLINIKDSHCGNEGRLEAALRELARVRAELAEAVRLVENAKRRRP